MGYDSLMQLIVLTGQITANATVNQEQKFQQMVTDVFDFLSVDPLAKPHRPRYSDRTGMFSCYSCMSLSYQENWPHLSKYYNMPHSFTNRCNDPFYPKGIGTVNCSTICVTLKETNIQGGVFLGYNVIRGCMDKVLAHGFNLTAIHSHRFRHFDVCRSLPRSLLFRPPTEDPGLQPLMGDVLMCACMGDRCNGAGSGTSVTPSTLTVFAMTLVSLMAFSWQSRTCGMSARDAG